LTVAAALALVAFGCLPAGVEAGTRHYEVRGRQLTRSELQGSNGYSILILVDRKGHLLVQTTKEAFTTEYWTHDTLSDPDRVKAKLPGLGSISVRFQPRGPVHRLPGFAGCEGPRPTLQPGVMRGTIEFTGEREYTQVKAHEADAEVEEWKSQRCRVGAQLPESRPPGIGDWTSWFSAETLGLDFVAKTYPPGVLEGGTVLYRAEMLEAVSERASVVINRRATLISPASTFDDAHPEHLTISPPPPFVGSGRLVRTPESVFAWRGDLSIQFPGLDPLSLTGPKFDSKYCRRDAGCIEQRFDRF
jgi:hypothetical protein